MKTTARQKIVILGCGNVAWHLAKQLHALKVYSISVYNHKANPAVTEFNSKLRCKVHTNFSQIESDADVYFICVDDKNIRKVAQKVNSKNANALLLHTSGSIKLSDLGERVHGTGVFYPLQTFSRSGNIKWKTVPVIIEGVNKETEEKIKKLARKFSDTLVVMPYRERLRMHLAAVIVNNFTNAMYNAADRFLEKELKKNDFKLLLPLINATSEKLSSMSPAKAQTGPAKRKDRVVIKKHLEILEKHKDLHKIYGQVSRLIIKQQKA